MDESTRLGTLAVSELLITAWKWLTNNNLEGSMTQFIYLQVPQSSCFTFFMVSLQEVPDFNPFLCNFESFLQTVKTL